MGVGDLLGIKANLYFFQEPPWLCSPAMYSLNLKTEDAPLLTNYLYVWTIFFFLSLSIVKKRQKMCFFMISQKCKLSVWSLYSSVSQSQCQFVFFFSFSLSKPCFVLYCSISDWTFAYGLNMCVQGGDVKVSTGRCFIFFNEIYYAYLYPYMSFVFVVVERKHFIGWKNLKKKKKMEKRVMAASQCLLACLHQLWKKKEG